ncbi:hypothetical protein, partial [Acinetobacter baumannii]|uniref:hypothetical protein n=1 Tax=Acinetobacter baumannii TaxID=470 RepID=UPI00197AD132
FSNQQFNTDASVLLAAWYFVYAVFCAMYLLFLGYQTRWFYDFSCLPRLPLHKITVRLVWELYLEAMKEGCNKWAVVS